MDSWYRENFLAVGGRLGLSMDGGGRPPADRRPSVGHRSAVGRRSAIGRPAAACPVGYRNTLRRMAAPWGQAIEILVPPPTGGGAGRLSKYYLRGVAPTVGGLSQDETPPGGGGPSGPAQPGPPASNSTQGPNLSRRPPERQGRNCRKPAAADRGSGRPCANKH